MTTAAKPARRVDPRASWHWAASDSNGRRAHLVVGIDAAQPQAGLMACGEVLRYTGSLRNSGTRHWCPQCRANELMPEAVLRWRITTSKAERKAARRRQAEVMAEIAALIASGPPAAGQARLEALQAEVDDLCQKLDLTIPLPVPVAPGESFYTL